MTPNLKKAGTSAGMALVLAVALASGPAAAVNLIGLNDRNQLLSFDSDAPGISSSVAISNLALGETIVSIDFRNPNRQLYGLGSLGNLYALNAATGNATLFGNGVVPAAAPGISYEIDWNPANNNLRVIGNAQAPNSNRAFTFGTGVTAVQTALTRADGGGALDVIGAAYNNNQTGSVPANLALYYLDAASDALFFNKNAFGGGVLTKVGDLTLNGFSFGVNNASGFDIAANGQAFVSWRENLYSIDLDSGALTALGSIGINQNVIGLTAAVPEPETYALMLGGLAALGFVARRRARR
jgi:hypothetical protein